MRFTSRKFLFAVAAALTPWVAPDVEIDALVKVGITSALAALYILVEYRLDRKDVDLKIEEHAAAISAASAVPWEEVKAATERKSSIPEHSHPDAASVESVNAALNQLQSQFGSALGEVKAKAEEFLTVAKATLEDPALD